MRTLRVIAKAGYLCPRENPKDKPIDDKEPVMVPLSSYYIRRIADGSLIEPPLSSASVEESKAAFTKRGKVEDK